MTSLLRGLDAATILTPYARSIADHGLSAVGRYLKSLTVAEVAALHGAGLGVWLIFETTATRSLGGALAGRADGARALAQAQALGAPKSVAIAATVDTDPSADQLPTIRDYFSGFDLTVGATLMAYACGSVLNELVTLSRPPIPWLAGAMGWAGSRAYDATNAWALKQGPQINAGRTASWAGIDWPALPFAYDPNVIARPDFGVWMPGNATLAVVPDGPASAPPSTVTIPPALDVQRALQALDLYDGALDGVWGPQSQAALTAFYAGEN